MRFTDGSVAASGSGFQPVCTHASARLTSSATSTTATRATSTNGSLEPAGHRRPTPSDQQRGRSDGRDPAGDADRSRGSDDQHRGRRTERCRRQDPAAGGAEPGGEPTDTLRPVGLDVGERVRRVGPEPQERPRRDTPPGGRGAVGEAEHDHRRQAAEGHDVGHPGPDRALEPEVVRPPGAHGQHVERARLPAQGERQGDGRSHREGRRQADGPHAHRARGEGLVRRARPRRRRPGRGGR